MLRIFPCCCVLIPLVWPAGIAEAAPPDDGAPSSLSAGATADFRDDRLGHVPPEVGARLEAAIRETISDERAEHHGLLGPAFHGRGPVAFEYVYIGEVLTNARGGIATHDATQYEGLFDLALLIDLEKTCLPVPGRFFLFSQNTHGRGLTEDFVGDAQVLSNIDSFDNIIQVAEYWWEVSLMDETLTFRLGKQDVNGEFLVVDMAGDFMQSSFGISPSLAIPTYPDTSAAAVVLAQVTPSIELKVGVWDGIPDGRNWGLSGTGITFTIGEMEYSYAICDGKLPGKLDAGIGYLSSGEVSPGDFAPQVCGYYLDFEQTVYRENAFDEDDEQGMGVFVQYGTGRPKDTVVFKDYLGAGIVYKGMIPCRNEDILGAGVAHARLNLGGTGRETAVEVFYKAHVAPWMTVQPDLQYIASPSGIYRDALIAGLRFEILL